MIIPSKRKPEFIESKFWLEIFRSIPPIIVAVYTAWKNFNDPPTHFKTALMLSGSAAWLGLASIFVILNARAQDRYTEEKDENLYDGLLGALHTLYGTLSAVLSIDEEEIEKLRITIMRVVYESKNANGEPQDLEQLLPYVGGAGGDPGRKLSIRCGIVDERAICGAKS